MSAGDAWAPLCDRRRLTVTVLTKARAATEGLTFRDGAELVGEVHPDDGDAFLLGFLTHEDAQTFIREMAPRELRVLVAQDENWWHIAGSLRRAMPAAFAH